MARPREFDEDCAIERAMLVFWQRGYAGTSIADLLEATGLGRQSLYNTFGDKQQLFEKALHRYTELALKLTGPLKADAAGLDAIRDFILNALGQQQNAECGACMIVKTAFDFQVPDPAIQERVSAAAAGTRKVLADVVARAQQRGEVICSRKPSEIANYLFSVQTGLSALAQTGATPREVTTALDLALDSVRESVAQSKTG